MDANSRTSSYGWVILVIATLALAVSNGLAIGGLPPFYKPIRDEFVALGAVDAARAESFIANGANITFLMSGVFSLIGGWMITKFALRPLMIFGSALLGGGLVILALADDPETVYFARFFMGASLGFIGVAPCVVLVSKWFENARGTALGILLTGTSIGGFLIPLVAAPMITAYGWRNAMLAISALVWIVLLPAIIFFIREPAKPADIKETAAVNAGVTLLEALKTPLFWALAVCAALIFYPIFFTTQQFVLSLQSSKIGVSAQTAAFTQSALFAMSLGGKFLAGFLSDRFDALRVFVLCALVMFIASTVLLMLTANNFLLFLLPFALGYGGTFVVLQRLVADFFGRREAGKILGLITLIEVAGAAIGGKITGYLADKNSGDYTTAFYGVTTAAACAFLATMMIYFLRGRKTISTD
ncbi:MAG: nitrate/nitrite transporter [Pyrinomonadaceae bacterium]